MSDKIHEERADTQVKNSVSSRSGGALTGLFPGLSRHWQILKAAWSDQNERDRNAKPQSDHEFLPAALEIIEKPPSAGLKWLLLVLCSLFAIALVWSFVGKVDVVATATGKVVPSSNTKVIQPIEIGTVRRILVRNGQEVKEGELLVELDPTISLADEAQSSQQLLSADVIEARYAAMLAHIEGRAARFVAPEGTPSNIAMAQQQYVTSAIAEYEAQKAGLAQQQSEKRAELQGANAEIAKLEETLPMLKEQLEGRRELTEKGYFPKLRLLEIEQLVVEHTRNIDIQRANAARASAAIRSLEAQSSQLRQGFARNAASERADALDRSALAGAELQKSTKRRELQQLRSPVDGTVQQLALTTVGGVVQPAEPVMVIVPREEAVEVNAQVLNRDIGFIHVGQPVRVKLEAFNFTDYGLIEGVVENISRDAIQDEQLGLVYAVKIRLNQNYLMVNGERTVIGPGLQVQAEIKTGERRIIDYLLSPIAKTLDEAGRER